MINIYWTRNDKQGNFSGVLRNADIISCGVSTQEGIMNLTIRQGLRMVNIECTTFSCADPDSPSDKLQQEIHNVDDNPTNNPSVYDLIRKGKDICDSK